MRPDGRAAWRRWRSNTSWAGAPRTTEQGNGSGVYIDTRGFFLTNYHVIEDTLGVRVRLPDGRALKVLDSAYDRNYDVAVLYTGPVEALAAVEAGSSAALRVGDPVFAIGYPRVGDDVLPGTLTMGVVSGLNRLDVTAGNISPDVGHDPDRRGDQRGQQRRRAV